MPITQSAFQPAWWLRSAHLQTLYPHLCRRPTPTPWTPERLELGDGDFVDLQWSGSDDQPLVCLFHGLEGSGESTYINGLRHALSQAGLASVLMQFRGCSGEPNRMARGYHSGDTGDIATLMQTVLERFPGRWIGATGFSLGGNALLKYLGELGAECPISQAVAVSVPFDLGQCADRLNSGLSRIYERHLLSKLNAKVGQRRGLMTAARVDVDAAVCSKSFREFDGRVVAPLFGFADADDYYTQSSCGQFLSSIARPTLILHALDDPFMTRASVPTADMLSEQVTLELSSRGGHVGFVQGPSPGAAQYWLDKRITAAFTAVAE